MDNDNDVASLMSDHSEGSVYQVLLRFTIDKLQLMW